MTPTNGSEPIRADVGDRSSARATSRWSGEPRPAGRPGDRLRHGPQPQVLLRAAHNRLLTGGWAREITARELPVATELAGVNMRLNPGGVREMHWHKEAEWAYMLAGRARITAIDAEGRNFIDDVGVGDLWNFPAGIPHSIQGLEEGCEFLLVFDDGNFSENETFLITDWFAHTPRDVLAKNFGVPEEAFADIPVDVERERYIFPGPVPGPIDSDAVEAPAGTCPSLQPPALAQEPIGPRAGTCGSSTRPTSRPRRRSPPRWWRSSRAGCASCTGTRTPTSGSTTSGARADDRVRFGRQGPHVRLPGR